MGGKNKSTVHQCPQQARHRKNPAGAKPVRQPGYSDGQSAHDKAGLDRQRQPAQIGLREAQLAGER